MKKLLLVFVISFAFISLSNAQKTSKIEEFDLSIESKIFKKKYKKMLEITKTLILVDGSKINVGDVLPLGESSKKTSNIYEAIMLGKWSNMMGANPLDSSVKVDTFIFDGARAYVKSGKVYAMLFLKDIKSDRYLTAFSTAFGLGELKNPNAPLTRKEAIAKLKESKDLLDLGMLTQEEFDALRKELTPIIMNK